MCALKKLRYKIRDHVRAGILLNLLVTSRTACIQVEPNAAVLM